MSSSLKQKIQAIFRVGKRYSYGIGTTVVLNRTERKVLGLLDETIRQIRQRVEWMILGKPAVFAEETEYDKGYSKGYYDAKEHIKEILAILESNGKEKVI